MKIVGNLIQLDPTKKYILLLEDKVFTPEQVQFILGNIQKGEAGQIVGIMLPNLQSVKFVEESESVVEITKSEIITPEL